MLSHVVITDHQKLVGLQEIWNSLFSADPGARLFNSFYWIESWMRFYWHASHKLNVVVIKSAEQPVALLPLYFNSHQNKIMFLGTGEPEHCEVASEYLDFLIDSNNIEQDSIYSFIREYLRSLPHHSFEFVNCLDSSHLFHITSSLKNVQRRMTGKRFEIDLSGNFEQLTETFSKNHRKKTREILNRFNKSDEYQFQTLTDENFEENWCTLHDLHTKDWEARGKPGAFADTTFSDFHKNMHDNYPQATQYFSYLTNKDRVIAINHYYQYRNVIHFYATGADKNNHKTLSPGILLHTLTLSSLSGQTLTYDFMKGAIKGSYKSKFCKSSGCFYTITVYSQDFSGKIKFATQLAKTSLSKYKQRLNRRLKIGSV